MPKTADRKLAIALAADSILKRKVDNLQVIPTVAVKLLRLVNSEYTSVADLSHLIETEPSLALKVLRNVNSAAFSLSHKITSINRAVNLLGFSTVRKIAINQLFYNKLIHLKEKREFDLLFFWQHCLFVASLSHAIAIAIKHKDPDLIYTAGLLHDIGKIVLETHGKVTYSDFLNASTNDQQSPLKGEQNFFGLDHAEMGYAFCQKWGIPEQIGAIVLCHHDMPDSESQFSDYALDISIISFANYIAWIQGIGSTTSNKPPELHPNASHAIDIKQLDIEILLNQVDMEMQDTRSFYGIEFPSLKTLRARLVESTIFLSHKQQQQDNTNLTNCININSLTIPHKSLNANEFVPWTLAAISEDCHFERLIMLNINSRQRHLDAAHIWPESLTLDSVQQFNIKMNLLPKILLTSLRDRNNIIVNAQGENSLGILNLFNVNEFLIAPIVSNNRLVALLYADNYKSQTPIEPNCIANLSPVLHQLGIALENATRFEQAKKRSELDPLTGLLNKRMITERLNQTFELDPQHLNMIAVGFIDIDLFKKFNDTCGHLAGDDALKLVAQILYTLTRPGDFIGRYGGEEFVFILHNTGKQGALSYAQRVREEIERKGKILSQRFMGHALTISIGVSMYDESYTTYTDIIKAADSAMYSAKQNGRNHVVIT